MKDITFVVANMVGGGTERVIANLANEMVNRGYRITIIMTAGNTVEYALDKSIQLISLGSPTAGRVAKRIERIKQLRTYYKEHKDTVILSFGVETNLYSILAGLGVKTKVVISERNDPNQCGYKVIRNMIYLKADKFVFQTPDAMKCFSKSIQERGRVIVNPLKENLPKPLVDVEKEKKIAVVGRLTAQKNHKLLLEAFAEFVKQYPDYQLVIYGQGELFAELEELILKLQIKENVTLAGFSPNVLEAIRDSRMYVLSSDYEGMSNSLMEAMAVGVAVISTDCPIGGSAMLINHYENGILVPVGDKEALLNAMFQLAQDDSLCEILAINAQKVRDEYTIDKICDEWVQFVEE